MVIGDFIRKKENGSRCYVGAAPSKNARIKYDKTKKMIPNLYKCRKCGYVFDYENWEQPARLQNSPFHDDAARCFNCGKEVEACRFDPDNIAWRDYCLSWRDGCETGENAYHHYFAVGGEVHRGCGVFCQKLCKCYYCGYIYDHTNWQQEGEVLSHNSSTGIITSQAFLTCPLCERKNVIRAGRSYDLAHQPSPEA